MERRRRGAAGRPALAGRAAAVPVALAALAVLLGLAGCTGSPVGVEPEDPIASATPLASAPPTGPEALPAAGDTPGAAAGARPLTVAPQARITLPAGMRVAGLTLAGSRL